MTIKKLTTVQNRFCYSVLGKLWSKQQHSWSSCNTSQRWMSSNKFTVTAEKDNAEGEAAIHESETKEEKKDNEDAQDGEKAVKVFGNDDKDMENTISAATSWHNECKIYIEAPSAEKGDRWIGWMQRLPEVCFSSYHWRRWTAENYRRGKKEHIPVGTKV